MTKYDVFMYDDLENETYETGIVIYTDTSKASICKKLRLDDPYKMDVFFQDGVIYVDYEGNPYCELHKREWGNEV